MTRKIIIKNPSPNLIQIYRELRDKKQRQMKMLVEKKHCTFTIYSII